MSAREYFIDEGSIVRRIWGKSDTILFIFAGAAAEFALNKAVDWLYFTGRLPSDPLGRLFSTVSYSRAIIFSEKQAALRAIDAMTAIHAGVQEKRSVNIPDWAFRDVLFMLIDYSIRAFEVLERTLTASEKDEVFNAFHAIGSRMGVSGLPNNFSAWETMRREHMIQHLSPSPYTHDLFNQYRKHLGAMRYRVLLESQTLVVPRKVQQLLGLRKFSLLHPVLLLYKISRHLHLDWIFKAAILPPQYASQIIALDQ
jgi:hypothetical protein